MNVTDEMVEAAEKKLSEVLSGYHYVMPTDGMRQVLSAALSPTVGTGEERQTPAPSTHMQGIALTEWERERLRVEASAKLAVYIGHEIAGMKFNEKEKSDKANWQALHDKLSAPAPQTREMASVPVDNQPVDISRESGDKR